MNFINIFIVSLRAIFVITVLTGVIYPVFITFFAMSAADSKRNGSLIHKNGKLAGSELIAQKFTSEKYFHSRPSAADFSTMPSGASNLGPTSKALKDSAAKSSVRSADMIFCSGSGLDPHITPTSAFLQMERIAKYRKLNEKEKSLLKSLIEEKIERRQFGFLGEERVNVLLLNLELDNERRFSPRS